MEYEPMFDPTIGAVVLAAGQSRRIGANVVKAMLPFAGVPLLRRVVEAIQCVPEVRLTCVVTGHERAQILYALQNLDVLHVQNPDYATGEMLSSIKTGLGCVRGRANAVLLSLGDQPAVRPDTIRTIIRSWLDADRSIRPLIVLPSYQGKHGHPILLDSRGIDEILALSGPDATLKTYTAAHAQQTIDVPVDDPAILEDIDTPADYERALKRWSADAEQLRSQTCPTARAFPAE
jgi:molybdenum cofactor cytidylyltransferase